MITKAAKREMIEAGIELLTTSEVARVLRVTEGCVRRWRAIGVGPQYLRFGGPDSTVVRYTLASLADFVNASYVRVPPRKLRASARRARLRG